MNKLNNRYFAIQEKIRFHDHEYYILDNGWSIYQNRFEEKFGNNIKKIKLLHSLIWLSLSGYVKDDYDSILTSFYKGTYLLNEFEKNYN